MKGFVNVMAGMIFSPILLVLGLFVLVVLFLANIVELVRSIIFLSCGRGWDFHFWTTKDLDWE